MSVSYNSQTRDAAANFPLISSGNWHTDGFGSASQGGTVVANRAYAVPFWPGRPVQITALSMNIGAAFTTPGTIRAGVYAALTDGSQMPGDLVADWGTIVESAATKSWTGLTTNWPAPTLGFMVFVAQGGSAGTPTWSCRNASHPLIFDPSAAAAVNPNTQRTAYYSDTGFSGALPASFGAVAAITIGPSYAVRLTAI